MKKKKLSVIAGRSVRSMRWPKCAGETVFAMISIFPYDLCELLRSPHPHARVLSIDAARALKLDGVFAVITARTCRKKFGIMPSTQTKKRSPLTKCVTLAIPWLRVVAATESLAGKGIGLYRCRI